MNNTQLTIEEKIKKIESSESFADLKTGWFPQSASTAYYFVSYCHKDYKKVFIDILGMQRADSEIAVWYDRELNVGRDWEKEAKTHIYDFDCLGVIFYVSENSVDSPAIFKEMQMAMDAGKPFIPILLPVENIRSKAGEYLSGAQLLDILYPRLSENDEKYRLYHEMFGEDILYFKNTDSPQDKIERIRKAFTRQPLLVLDNWNGAIIAVNNINVIEISESDYKLFDERNQQIKIVEIWKCAFSNCRQLETVVIPKTIRGIDKFAFYNCKKLKTVEFSKDSKLKYINDSAFMNCENLENITLPNGTIEIGNHAFYNCSSLTSITIPNGVTSIGDSTFFGCSSLTSITIPDSVTSIGAYAFAGCSSLTNVTIPNSVTSIGAWAFSDCSSLTSITIPNGVTSIGDSAFFGCSSLTSITIPDSVTSIGSYAFSGCSSLTSITIPNSVTSIGAWAFSDCSSLTSITIGNSVTSIGSLAFYNCSSLTSITIPNSVKSIEMSPFVECKSLTRIIFDGTMAEWEKIDECSLFLLGIDEDAEEITVSCTDGEIKIG